MALPIHAKVEAAPNFLANLDAAHQFFLIQGADSADSRLTKLKAPPGNDRHLGLVTSQRASSIVRYILHRLEVAGRQTPLFTEAAMERIAEAARGIPRSINIICDTALVYGFSGEVDLIDQDIVNDVINDRATYGVFGGER